jgi:hypothetical protein
MSSWATAKQDEGNDDDDDEWWARVRERETGWLTMSMGVMTSDLNCLCMYVSAILL